MSDYVHRQDKISAHIDSLYRKHRLLDDDIKKKIDNFASEAIIKELKNKKLLLKDEIYRLETELKELG
jgi:hypothetical protein